jgi:hypothetical protein
MRKNILTITAVKGENKKTIDVPSREQAIHQLQLLGVKRAAARDLTKQAKALTDTAIQVTLEDTFISISRFAEVSLPESSAAATTDDAAKWPFNMSADKAA